MLNPNAKPQFLAGIHKKPIFRQRWEEGLEMGACYQLNLHKHPDIWHLSDPDNISARLLKKTSSEIAPALALIFQASLCQQSIPDDLHKANETPIYKPEKKDRGKAENYKPIPLKSISCKMLEHIIHINVMNYLCTNNILSDAQHSFRKSRSCETHFIMLVNDMAKSLNDGSQLDAALLDFSKVFDKVYHRNLCLKLEDYAIRGELLNWIKNYLSNITQKVIVEGKIFDSITVISGVPQRTVLELSFFLLYINDLPDSIKCKIGLFADDSVVYNNIISSYWLQNITIRLWCLMFVV